MILLALDTATPSTVVALQDDDGRVREARDDPPAGTRPRHAETVLALAEDLLAATGRGWDELARIAVGVGPGGFTGLRIGISTARALAQAHGTPIAGISSLRALALGAREAAGGRAVLAAIDARRGEVFAAAWSPDGEPLLRAAAYKPDALPAAVSGFERTPLAVGDGAVRFSNELAAAGLEIPAPGSPLHAISGRALCQAGARAAVVERDRLLPDYRREPDAKPAQR